MNLMILRGCMNNDQTNNNSLGYSWSDSRDINTSVLFVYLST